MNLVKGSEICFIFVVDRSGSMSGRRMEITKEALKIFIQSLPVGCTFAILGFGSTSEFVLCKNSQLKRSTATNSNEIWTYNDKNLPIILSEIS